MIVNATPIAKVITAKQTRDVSFLILLVSMAEKWTAETLLPFSTKRQWTEIVSFIRISAPRRSGFDLSRSVARSERQELTSGSRLRPTGRRECLIETLTVN